MATINNMTTTPTHDNDGTPYTIAVDDAKEGAQLFDLTPWFKGRVGDNLSPLDMLWRHQGRISDLTNLKPVISGKVGHYSFEKDDQGVTQMVMASDASTVYQEGAPSNCQAGGRVTYHFSSQVFPKEGAFKGYLGLMDTTTGKLVSSIDVWFKVLPGIAQMGIACDYYIDVLDKAIANFAEKARQHDIDYQAALTKARQDFESQTNQALAELQAKYDQDVAASHEASIKARTSLSDLADTAASINAQIKAGDIVKKTEFDKTTATLSNAISMRLAQIKNEVKGYADADAIKQAYPNGADGIFVAVDTGHQWYYINGEWVDAGPYQSASTSYDQIKDLPTNIWDGVITSDGGAEIALNNKDFNISVATQYQGAITSTFTTTASKVNITGKLTFSASTLSCVIQIMVVLGDGSYHYVDITRFFASDNLNFELNQTIDLDSLRTKYPEAKGWKVRFFQGDTSGTGLIKIENLNIYSLYGARSYDLYDSNFLNALGKIYKKFSDDDSEIAKRVTSYDDLHVGTYANLWTGAMTTTSGATVVTNGPFVNATESQYQEATTGHFDSFSSSVHAAASVKAEILDGTGPSKISIEVVALDQAGSEILTRKIGECDLDSSYHKVNYKFDAANLTVYSGAKHFALRFKNVMSNKILLHIDDLLIYETDENFEENKLYDDNFKSMMSKVFSAVGGLETAVTLNNDVYTNSRGDKYSLGVDIDGKPYFMNHIPNKTLIMGNSITLGLDTDGSKGGAFGLAASDSKHDWAYLVEQAILAKNASATFTKLHDAAFEQAENDEASAKYLSDFASYFTSDLDLALIQIGDNVDTDARKQTFAKNLYKLVQAIKNNSPKCRIVFVACWFNQDVVSTISAVARKYGCELSDIRSTYGKENMGSDGQTITFNNSATFQLTADLATHPGDKGMQAIADKVISTLDM